MQSRHDRLPFNPFRKDVMYMYTSHEICHDICHIKYTHMQVCINICVLHCSCVKKHVCLAH